MRPGVRTGQGGGSLHTELFLKYLHKHPLELPWRSGPVGTYNLSHSMSSVAIRLSREWPCNSDYGDFPVHTIS